MSPPRSLFASAVTNTAHCATSPSRSCHRQRDREMARLAVVEGLAPSQPRIRRHQSERLPDHRESRPWR